MPRYGFVQMPEKSGMDMALCGLVLADFSAGVAVRISAAVAVANITNKRKSRCRCMPTSFVLPPQMASRSLLFEDGCR
jgi:hypothetical protein